MSEEAPLLDLSALDFRPSWAKERSGVAPVPRGGDDRVHRGEGSGRPSFPREGPLRREGFRGAKGGRGGPKGGDRRPREQSQRPEPPPNPFPWLRIAFVATPPAVETVARQIRHTGRTYSLFDIARILLRNPESYTLDLTSAPPPSQGPFYLAADGSVWLTLESAARHILRTRLEDFYRVEIVEVEPPKGQFTSVAVCGISGALLGPTNLHDYERKVRALHRAKFSHMGFEAYRSRLRVDRSPEMVEKWRAEASKATRYFLKGEEGTEALESLEAVERHFLAHHAAEQIRSESFARVSGDPKKARVDSALGPLLNHACAEEERFPLRLAQSLSRALSEIGLRFHKNQGRTTLVSAARPRHLNLEETAVSDSLKKIIELVRGRKHIRRRELLDLLAPLPPEASVAPVAEAADVPSQESAEAVASEVTPASVAAVKSPEEAARDVVIQDLLWLTHEGYVIEYADSRLELVPPPKNPPKASVVLAEAPVEAVTVEPEG